MKFVVTIRETTDHQILVDCDTKDEAMTLAEIAWRDDHDRFFDVQIGPRAHFVRRATKKDTRQ